MRDYLTHKDLLDALEMAETPEARKTIKNMIYQIMDPDPLTVIDPDATDRNPPIHSIVPDLHDQHSAVSTQRSRGTGISRWLDRSLLDRRQRKGGLTK